jgi:hypothetical protein
MGVWLLRLRCFEKSRAGVGAGPVPAHPRPGAQPGPGRHLRPLQPLPTGPTRATCRSLTWCLDHSTCMTSFSPSTTPSGQRRVVSFLGQQAPPKSSWLSARSRAERDPPEPSALRRPSLMDVRHGGEMPERAQRLRVCQGLRRRCPCGIKRQRDALCSRIRKDT